ncbi:MAG: xanthine dehydrogenase family protein subunit M [Acidobacteria bacterium]|nr:xanthine dehydrogenase family protein subunit M [Acidobacteriota bacterium]
MIPASFSYVRPKTIDETIALLAQHGHNAKVLAGGHSLLPAMKLRLAQPGVLIDIGRVSGLNTIAERDARLAIGAMATHGDIESSGVVAAACPLLCQVAAHIGDVQVRNRGTIGGSLVHADPAADWPAAIVALEAELRIASPRGSRVVKAADFFEEMLQTSVKPDELLVEVVVPKTARSVAYVKTEQKASGFALCGVAVVVDSRARTVAIGITGVGTKPYRAKAVEEALRGRALATDLVAAASGHAADGVEALGDIHASPEYRAHLACVNTRRAILKAAAQA